MIGGRQQGPFALDQLHDAGVRPDTYVWCKGMADWEMASQVPDICRYFRLRLSDSLPKPSPDEQATAAYFAPRPAERDASGEDHGFIRNPRQIKDAPPHPKVPKWIPWVYFVISILFMLLGLFIVIL